MILKDFMLILYSENCELVSIYDQDNTIAKGNHCDIHYEVVDKKLESCRVTNIIHIKGSDLIRIYIEDSIK